MTRCRAAVFVVRIGGGRGMEKGAECARVFKAFCDVQRIQILELLGQRDMCACELLGGLTITQPTLSHHMKILCDAEVVVSRKEGKMVYYSINRPGVEYTRQLLFELLP